MSLAPDPGAAWVEGQPVDLVPIVGDDRYVDAWGLGSGRRGPSARARRRLDRVEVTVKVAGAAARAATRKSFIDAADRRLAVRSPHLAPILDRGISAQGHPWLVVPWFLNGPVGDGNGVVAVDDAVESAQQVATGLAALHGAGLVHANVTPTNVLVAQSGLVALDGSSLPGLAPHLPNGEVGPHVPPEVIEGGDWDPSGDVWSLGSCLHAWLRGKPPWSDAAAKGTVAWLLAVSTEPPARTRRADLPAWLDGLIGECLSGDASGRPTARQVADRLQPGSAPVRTPTLAAPVAAEGRALGSNYVLLEPVGAGATGQVWRGERRWDGQAVAVKLLRPELTSSPEAVARFLRERTTLVGLHHPNLVSVLDLVAEGETLGIVMDLVDGSDLRKLLTDGGPLRSAQACGLVAQVAAGVASMHEAGLVHRDLKPENVLVEQGRARVTDFGIARALHGPSVTRTEQLVGTAEYLAPELVAGRPLTPAADVYSLGVLLYEMVCGWRPFEGEHPAAVLRSHLDAEPGRPDGLPDPVWELIVDMMAKDPAERPPARDIATYAAQLEEWLGALGPDAYPPLPKGSARPARPVPLAADSGGSANARPGWVETTDHPRPLADPVPPSVSSHEPAPPGAVAVDRPAAQGGETSYALAPLRLEPAPAGAGPARPTRGRRWYFTIAGLAVLVLGAAGAGVALSLDHSPAKPIPTTDVDVTTAVTLGSGGTVTVTWPQMQAGNFVLMFVKVQPAIPGRTDPLAAFAQAAPTRYQVTGTPPGRHCFSAVAAFSGQPPAGLGHSPNPKECLTVP